MEQYGIGQPVLRREDQRFLTGSGRYVDDIATDSCTHAVFVRSPHAHADILAIDAQAALAMPGVLAIIVAADLLESNVQPMPTRTAAKNSNGAPVPVPPWMALAHQRVRFTGEAVAMVVAESRAMACDAAEQIEIDYKTLPYVTDAAAALAPDAPILWPDIGSNICVDFTAGDREATHRALASADHQVTLEMHNQRVVAAPLEPRGAIADWHAKDGRHLLTCTTQNVHANRNQIANDMLGIDPADLRLTAPDVGGGFGAKNPMYPEYTVMLHASRQTGRPVKWISDRGESFLSDCHGRDQRSVVRLGLSSDGRFIAFDVESIGNTGPYVMSVGPFTSTGGSARTQGGAYRFDHIHFHSRAMFTNTTPTDPYRGAGRPEATMQIERVIDYAAAELGFDPLELRRINALTDNDMPYTSKVGTEIDSGNCRATLAQATAIADWNGFTARGADSAERGLHRGIGIGLYLECGGGAPKEHARIQVLDDGRIHLAVGSQSTGMGHETVFSQLLANRLGLPIESIVYIQGDTDATPIGGGHGGSRGLEMGGASVLDAADVFIAKLKLQAAEQLETAIADIEFKDGGYVVVGTDKRLATQELLTTLSTQRAQVLPELASDAQHERNAVTYPNGCHICEVEVDADTGIINILRYSIVDDFGVIVNPLTAAGQVMGGTVQGLGQAMLEQIVYDDSGQLITGSLMDYCLPRADDLSGFDIEFYADAPTERNPLGVKGSGEAGCCGALPALVNAVCNALQPLGVKHIEMPLTPLNVWQAIQAARD
jgi:carbon-monoxide dehydrogenase large subunit